nr:hypothetical protein [Nonomuraea sp. SBT364]
MDDRRDATPGGWVVTAGPEGDEFCVEAGEQGQAMSSTARNGSRATVAGVAPVHAMTSRCRWDWSV